MEFLRKILSLLLGTLSGKKTSQTATAPERFPQPEAPPSKKPSMKPSDKISDHFTWKEALWLPQYARMANEEEDGLTEDHRGNLKSLFKKMDLVREFFDSPIIVHVAYRSKKYNHELYERMNQERKEKGLPPLKETTNSPHMQGLAVDFHVKGLPCAEARKRILEAKKLEEWGMRMENIEGEWVHLDTRQPGPSGRFFRP
jgi:uncharacterized protein YcbK (DUF882 family)